MNKHIETVQKLLEIIDESKLNIAEIKLTEEEGRQVCIKLKQDASPVVTTLAPSAVAAAAPPPSSTTITDTATASESPPPSPKKGTPLAAPMVGTVYLAPSPGAEPFLKVGQSIKKGDTICLIEAMKMFNKVEAEHDGKVIECLVKNAQAVEFDQPLFMIDTDNDH